MHSVCLQCQWKALSHPSRQFTRGIVIRQHQPTLHFDRYHPKVEVFTANGVEHNRIVWKPKKPLGEPLSQENVDRAGNKRNISLKERGKLLAKYSARGKNPDQAHPLHFLRAMLRECTYFPDEHVRRQMTAYIIDRFRRKSRPETFKGTEKEAHMTAVQLIARARRGLTYLQRANMGRVDEYTRTLLMAYGRMGKRRHVLLSKIREDDARDSPDYNYVELAVKKQGVQVPPGTDLPTIGPRMYALIKSQSNKDMANNYRTNLIKALPLQIPEKNAWGRQMPKRRQKNKVFDWHRKLVDGVLPPLPSEEYARLEALARGADRSIREIPRRVAALDLFLETGGKLDTLHTLPRDEQSRRPKRKVPHSGKILPYRFIRRRLQLIFQLCPKLTMGADDKWQVTWGDVVYTKTPAPDEPGDVVQRKTINPRDDPRALEPIKEAATDIENDSPEGDASREIRRFLEYFSFEQRYAPDVPGKTSEDIALPNGFYKKVDRLISRKSEDPKPSNDESTLSHRPASSQNTPDVLPQ